MTNEERQEAIRIIKSECYISDLLNLDRTRMVNSALDKAVEALGAEPCEDCISREAALNGFRSGRVCDEVAEDCIRDCQFCNDDGNCMIMKFLDGLPSVKPIAENATTTEDCVSRREAVLGFEKDVVCNFIGDCGICQFYQDESCLMTKFLYSLPSVKPTRPKGEWKLVREINGVCMYKCSLCGRLVLAFRGGVLENYPYCNCGAEMEANNE